MRSRPPRPDIESLSAVPFRVLPLAVPVITFEQWPLGGGAGGSGGPGGVSSSPPVSSSPSVPSSGGGGSNGSPSFATRAWPPSTHIAYTPVLLLASRTRVASEPAVLGLGSCDQAPSSTRATSTERGASAPSSHAPYGAPLE